MPGHAAEVVRRMYAAFNELATGGDIEQYVAAHWDPACEYHPVEEIEPVRGHDALVAWHHRWFDAWDEFRARVAELIESDGPVVACLDVEGRGSATGLSLTRPFFHVIDVRDGHILRIREFDDRDEAMRAAGLRDDAPEH